MPGFIPLVITEVRHESRDAISVALDVPPALRPRFTFKPGQHINVRASIDGQDVQRTYSICSDPADAGLRIAIKRIDGGIFSTWANTALKAGMTLLAEPPTGRFVLSPADPAAKRRVVLGVAAGIGITPVIGILRQALLTDCEARVILIYGNRTIEDAVFREDLEVLKDRYVDRITVLHILSRSEETESPLLEGRIDSQKIQALAPHVLDVQSLAHAYLCGPGSLIKEVRDTLFVLGLPRDRVHHEFFAAGGGAYRAAPTTAPVAPAAGMSEGSVEVVATLDGIRHKFPMSSGETVVEAALRAGLRVPYACKGGMCCTCRAKLVSGEARMRANYSLEPWEIEQGFVLTCQATAVSRSLVIDYDQM